MNKRKNMIMKEVWFKSEREYNELKESLLNNEDEIVLNILKRMVLDGDL